MMMDASPTATAAAVGGLTFLYLLWRRIRRHFENKKPFEGLPMVPDSHFLLGHRGLFASDFQACHKRHCYDNADENGVCSFWLLNHKVVSVTRWQDVRAILQASVEHDSVALVETHMAKFLGKKNILSLKGKEWKYQRAAILRVFHSNATLLESRAAMEQVTQTLVESLKAQPQQPVEMDADPLMKMITMDVFAQTALSCDFECCKTLKPSPIARAFDFLESELLRRLQNPLVPTNMFYSLPTEANRRHAYESNLIRNFLLELVAARRQEKPEDRKPDLLTSLIKAHEDMREQATEEMTDEKLVDVLISLLFAGYDTTSVALTYALYIIATHPEVEKLCLQEIDRVWKQDCNLSDPEHLVYCGGVIAETLRMYPPAFVVGRMTSDKSIQLSNGFIVPEQTFVLIPIYMIQHDAKHFERPEEFHAERWVKLDGNTWVERDANDTASSNIPPGNRQAVFAFSGGARSCAAQKFATQEATLVLATLIKELKFAVEPGYVPQPVRHGIIQNPRNGMPMSISVRK